MPSLDVRDITPDYKSIWRCPCGWEGPFASYRGHRRGYKTRPECHGPGEKVWDPAMEDSGEGPHDSTISDSPPDTGITEITEVMETPDTTGPADPTEAAEDGPEALGGLAAFEYRGLDDVPLGADWGTEEWARHFNTQRQQGEPPSQDGNGELPPGGLVPPIMTFPPGPGGQFEAEPSIGPPHLTTTRQTIVAPPILYVIYDYMVGIGWWQGDGSLSALVIDFVLDHFHN